MSNYSEWLPKLLPRWLTRTWGLRWHQTLGATADVLVARAKTAVYVRGAQDPEGRGREVPVDGLAFAGADRVIERLPGESDDAYRARIVGAWETWRLAGTRPGITYGVELLGYGIPAIWTQRVLPRPGPSGMWARMTLVFPGFAAWDGDAVWEEFDWDSRLYQEIESNLTATARTRLRRTLRQWINARDHVSAVIVGFGSTLWDMDRWDGFDWDDGAADPVTWEAPPWDSDEASWDGFVWDYFI